MKKILVVDDDREFRDNLTEILNGAGYGSAIAATGRDAVEQAIADDFDVILLDMIMPGPTGLDTLLELRKVSPRSKVIMITAFATIEHAVEAIKKGASEYISKPFKIDLFLTTIRRVLEEARIGLCEGGGDFDCTINALSNPLRRTILHLLSQRKQMRLMEIARELGVEDHTKAIFHLRILRDAAIVRHDEGKSYSLTPQGERAVECLKILEAHLSSAK